MLSGELRVISYLDQAGSGPPWDNVSRRALTSRPLVHDLAFSGKALAVNVEDDLLDPEVRL